MCLTRLASLISAGYERKGDSLHDCGGYVLALSKLWSRAHAYPNPDPTLPNSIIAHILDSLRRVDATVSLSFRAHCVLALSSVVAHKLHELVRCTITPSPLPSFVETLSNIPYRHPLSTIHPNPLPLYRPFLQPLLSLYQQPADLLLSHYLLFL